MMATCISSSRCVGRDNVLTKAVGWKFANSGAHTLDYSGTALGTWLLAVLPLALIGLDHQDPLTLKSEQTM